MENTVYIIKGEVTNLEAWPNHKVELGDPEWQVSDGPPGARSYSEDFLSLEDALAACEGKRVIIEQV